MPRRIEVSLLTKTDRVRLVGFITNKHIYFKDARNACILALLYYCGLKTHELASLNIDSYDRKKNLIHIKKRVIKLVLEREILLNYLTFRRDKYKPLFISVRRYNDIQRNILDKNKSLRLTDRSIQRAVKDVFRLLRIFKDIKPKDFRHLLGIRLSGFGASHKTIDEVIGKSAPWVKTDYRKRSKKYKSKSLMYEKPKNNAPLRVWT